jgi:hypothetical protein
MKKDTTLNSKIQSKTEITNKAQEDNFEEELRVEPEPETKRQRK